MKRIDSSSMAPMEPAVGSRAWNRGLSKSSLASFEQCPKRLWLSIHAAEPYYGPFASAQLIAGHLVGMAARDLVRGGTLVDATDHEQALTRTKELLAGGTAPIFEAAFSAEGVLVRVDILEPCQAGGWRILEVKSTTDVKPEHLGDLATQVWAVAAAGLEVRSAAIRHLDRTFTLASPGNYEGAFTDREMLHDVQHVVGGRAEVVSSARKMLAAGKPEHPMGAHCSNPHVCPFTDHCRSEAPPEPLWPVTVLPNGGGKKWLMAGISDMEDIDPAELKNPTHLKVHRATVSSETYHDPLAACAVIDSWPFPRTWLDFETIAFPLPRWVGTRPYEQVPFQFSAHIEHSDGRMEHREFLSLDGKDPRRTCAEALAALPNEGAVVAYNAPFERGCIDRLALLFPDLADHLRSLSSRLVDLLPVTRATWYHRDQRGSWSIKAVLPTMSDLTYLDMHVRDGVAAQQAYLEALTGATPERIAELDAALRAYCRRDTEAMIAVARRLMTR